MRAARPCNTDRNAVRLFAKWLAKSGQAASSPPPHAKSMFKALELTAAFTFAERTFPAPPYQQESGRFLRLQVQFNF